MSPCKVNMYVRAPSLLRLSARTLPRCPPSSPWRRESACSDVASEDTEVRITSIISELTDRPTARASGGTRGGRASHLFGSCHSLSCKGAAMAPLFIPCHRLPHVYSPLSSRGGRSLSGQQGRSVPFVRPCKAISRVHTVTRAVSENVVEKQEDNGRGSNNGPRESGNGAQPSAGMLAVHGGERAGRPRVSGAQPCQHAWVPI